MDKFSVGRVLAGQLLACRVHLPGSAFRVWVDVHNCWAAVGPVHGLDLYLSDVRRTLTHLAS